MGKGHKSDPKGLRSDNRHSGNYKSPPPIPDNQRSDRVFPSSPNNSKDSKK